MRTGSQQLRAIDKRHRWKTLLLAELQGTPGTVFLLLQERMKPREQPEPSAGASARAKRKETLLLLSKGGDAFPAHSSRALPIPLHRVVKQQVLLCRCGQLAIRADKRLRPWSRSCECCCWEQPGANRASGTPVLARGAGRRGQPRKALEMGSNTLPTSKKHHQRIRGLILVSHASPPDWQTSPGSRRVPTASPRCHKGTFPITRAGHGLSTIPKDPASPTKGIPIPQSIMSLQRGHTAAEVPRFASSPTLLHPRGRPKSNRCLGRTQDQHRPPQAAPGANCSTRPHARSNDCKGRVIAVV